MKKTWLLNILFVVVALTMGAGLFFFKYQVARQEQKLKKLYQQINQLTEEIHIFQAQWSSDTNPERLQILVTQQTELKDPQPQQMIGLQNVPTQKK